ncbi:hypothetical protein [Gynurincola endophyticus]|uniref:hypothetical protein n=1 Tax=Gynurincola endophyticus TaxID=2479004 RepID=UPI000F8EA202|nr:hypothetical protein [Gynurincola endophyticus]
MKNCLFCQNKLVGRSDKKFCTEFCRNQFNNHRLTADNQLLKSINIILKRNRNILKHILASDTSPRTVHLNELLQNGFNVHFFTHALISENTFFCYDFGFQ